MLVRIRALVNRHPMLVLALVVVGVFTVMSTAVTVAAPPGEPISQIELQLVRAVNAERKKVGAQPLIVNYSLMEAAWKHTVHQANVIHDICHEGCGDGTVRSRIEATGYKWADFGENVARGQRSVSEVMTAWMGSPGHKRNILNKDFTDIGVGHVTSDYHYWTQVFGVPKSPPEYVTVTPPAGASRPCELTGDLDFDGSVGGKDVNLVAAKFMTRQGGPGWEPRFDLVPDGVVNVYDVYDVASRMGDVCEP